MPASKLVLDAPMYPVSRPLINSLVEYALYGYDEQLESRTGVILHLH